MFLFSQKLVIFQEQSYRLFIFYQKLSILVEQVLLQNDTIMYGKAKESKNPRYFDKLS